MADNNETGSDAQITFKVKSSNDKTHTITMDESATVLDLKNKLAGADFEDIPADRQRLIYSGRIMKDSDALSVYKIKNMNTIHMVKSARSNAQPAASGSSSTPTPAAVPQNMAAGSVAGDPLAGLTGARFAGHANLPSADLFGADGGMGAPPSEDQLADMLSNPMIAQTMNEALNNPNFIDMMIRTNPALAAMPNAREMLQSPYFRNMMTNPEAIRMAARMRRVLQGGGGSAFPAPGATDNTPADAPGSGNAATTGNNNNNNNNNNDDPLRALFGAAGDAGNAPSGFPLASLLGMMPPAFGSATPGAAGQAAPANPPQSPSSTENRDAPAAGANTQGQAGSTTQPAANPFAALFGGAAPGANANNPFGLPPISPEALQQMAQLLGLGGAGAAPAAPPDNRPPEERYAEQLRQLNDMGFYDFDRNVTALRRSGGSVQGAVEYLLSNP
ncbi:hypothetical protein MYCTH_2294490 [Thermothelomyces thermophilus ATCC 42464]|uniref:Deubiquitination-protection protein dph1 n=1 Tax=Thermothelomyces thermophilus (strain ATCC 42464 / BCRC 31852 / DSM 1799) TaxID=573729 RepID=G2Q1P5_THET4|nr:uncharacterized protein MYCTH_2294490 [Thermothelomyces thermophilus ATCC 42464]AEO53329.1 hypothetical protein MYCTH_2294490 [Thermothelomyces thermophilus ATCC 42464]